MSSQRTIPKAKTSAFSSYSSPRNTSGAIQYGEPTTANGSFLAPSLQRQGGQNLQFRYLPQTKGDRASLLSIHRKQTGGFTHVQGTPGRLG